MSWFLAASVGLTALQSYSRVRKERSNIKIQRRMQETRNKLVRIQGGIAQSANTVNRIRIGEDLARDRFAQSLRAMSTQGTALAMAGAAEGVATPSTSADIVRDIQTRAELAEINSITQYQRSIEANNQAVLNTGLQTAAGLNQDRYVTPSTFGTVAVASAAAGGRALYEYANPNVGEEF